MNHSIDRYGALFAIALISAVSISGCTNLYVPAGPRTDTVAATIATDRIEGEYAMHAAFDNRLLLAESDKVHRVMRVREFDPKSPVKQIAEGEIPLPPAPSEQARLSWVNIAIGPQHKIVSVIDEGSREIKAAFQSRASAVSGHWSLVSLASVREESFFSRLVVSPAGRPTLLYQAVDRKDGLRLRTYLSDQPEADILNETTVEANSAAGEFADLLWVSDELLYIAFRSARTLRLALWNRSHSALVLNKLLDSEGNPGAYVRLGLDRAKRLVVVYHDTEAGDLRIARSMERADLGMPDTFETATLDSDGVTGMDIGLTFFDGDTPVVTYLDATRLALKIAIVRDLAAPTVRFLENPGAEGVVGFYTGITPIPGVTNRFWIHHHIFRQRIGNNYSFNDLGLLEIDLRF